MSVGAISAAGLGQSVLSSSGASQVQQTLQTLQNSLAAGNLNTASSQFAILQNLFQSSATASGSSASTNTQLSTDLTALGSALSSGDLPTAQSAFATVQNDLKNSASPTQTNEISAASQSVQLVQQILGSLDTSAASTTDNTSSLLGQVYGSKSGLNVIA
jgi:hypothetical protein